MKQHNNVLSPDNLSNQNTSLFLEETGTERTTQDSSPYSTSNTVSPFSLSSPNIIVRRPPTTNVKMRRAVSSDHQDQSTTSAGTGKDKLQDTAAIVLHPLRTLSLQAARAISPTSGLQSQAKLMSMKSHLRRPATLELVEGNSLYSMSQPLSSSKSKYQSVGATDYDGSLARRDSGLGSSLRTMTSLSSEPPDLRPSPRFFQATIPDKASAASVTDEARPLSPRMRSNSYLRLGSSRGIVMDRPRSKRHTSPAGTIIDLSRSVQSITSKVRPTPPASPLGSPSRRGFKCMKAREQIALEGGVIYQLGNCIGSGQFGEVYRALNLDSGQMVAIKRISIDGRTETEVQDLMHEVNLLKSLRDNSIVRYEGFYKDSDYMNIVIEYVENGSLLHTLRTFGSFPEKLTASYTIKILEGLQYLHDQHVVHCDLKAANILTTKNGNIKLTDFGVSLNLQTVKKAGTEEINGTPNWLSPEVIQLKGVSPAADIWALGCTIIEMLTGYPPYSGINTMSAMFRIVEDKHPPLPEGCSLELVDLLLQVFQREPINRPSAKALNYHAWIIKHWRHELQNLGIQDSLPMLNRRVTSKIGKGSVLSAFSAEEIKASTVRRQGLQRLLSNSGTILRSPDKRPLTAPVSSVKRNSNATTDHSFVKSHFSQSVLCKFCAKGVKKALFCESLSASP